MRERSRGPLVSAIKVLRRLSCFGAKIPSSRYLWFETRGARRGKHSRSFIARLICSRHDLNLSYDSVLNAGTIVVTTTDESLPVDSVKRCKG